MFEYSVSSFLPITDINIGFWIALSASVIIISAMAGAENRTRAAVAIIAVIILSIVGYYSFTTDTSIDCSKYQERIVAEFVGFAPEVYRERQGKHDVTKHKIYAQYRYGSENIITEITNSSAPKFAYFYRIDTQRYPRCSKQ